MANGGRSACPGPRARGLATRRSCVENRLDIPRTFACCPRLGQLRSSGRCSPDFAVVVLRIPESQGCSAPFESGGRYSRNSGSCSRNGERVGGTGRKPSTNTMLRTVQQPPTGGEIRESLPLLVFCPWRLRFVRRTRPRAPHRLILDACIRPRHFGLRGEGLFEAKSATTDTHPWG